MADRHDLGIESSLKRSIGRKTSKNQLAGIDMMDYQTSYVSSIEFQVFNKRCLGGAFEA